ncbi:MAG: PEP-CTERM sorting domain-containing protein [Verrucomicrobiales bacterium]|nr:PEP-CTERM sorting domain-containing protein [Verrucomicrobiales bacterium]
MTTWTPAAESFFRDFLSSHFGARPADEVAHDIRCHVHEELSQLGVDHVTRTELQRVVEDLHPNQSMVEAESAFVKAPVIPAEDTNKPTKAQAIAAAIFYVILPVAVLVMEGIFHWCAMVFFDPMPTLAHAALLFLVPIVTGSLLWKQTPWTPQLFKTIACLSGIALVVSIYYVAITFWWIPFALIGVVYFGLGLVPLAPPFAMIGISRARTLMWRSVPSAREIPWKTWSRRGVYAGVAALIILELPSYVGRVGLSMATSENAVTRERGLSLIRIAGTESDLLRKCYDTGRGWAGNRDAAGMVLDELSDTKVSSGQAQKVYFLATGTPYNEVEPPRVHSRLYQRDQWDTVTFDSDQGGDRVGGRLRGLFMDTSRMDTHVDAAARLSYTEWTVEFENLSPDTHEARCQVQLPPEGVVSRVTLWINDEPEEAAFGPNNQVKQAYKSVVTVERRDPVLVTVSGPGRVLVQCFPVLPRKRMKVRLGITAPWSPIDPEVVLPRVVERNFGFPRSLKHHVWAQGDGHGQGTQFAYTNKELLDKSTITPNQQFVGEDLPEQIWSRDPFAQGPHDAVLVGKRITELVAPVEHVIIVLDNSEGMKPFVPMLKEQLSGIPEDQIGFLVASHSTPSIQTADILKQWNPRHGTDSLPALHHACSKLRKETKSGAVVWLHTAHPEVSSIEPLRQILSHQDRLQLYDISLTHGTNAISEALKKIPQFRHGPVMSSNFDQQLGRFLHGLTNPTQQDKWSVTRQSANCALPINAIQVDDQFPRYTKYLEGMTAWRERRSVFSDWSKQLAHYQLVTPISGAVVLERQEQYEQHGLKQVDKKTVPHMPTVPSVPEPSSATLLMLGIFAISFRRKR